MSIDQIGTRATQRLRGMVDDAVDIEIALDSVTQPQRASKSRRAWLIPALVVSGILLIALVTSLALGGVKTGPVEPASTDSPQPTPTDNQGVGSDAPAYFVDIESRDRSPLPSAITAIPFARNFDVSPDGTMLAFTDTKQVYVANLDGSQLRTIDEASMSSAPQWSADNRTLVYAWNSTIVSAEVETGEVTTVFTDDKPVYRPNPNPDGDTILFTRDAGRAYGLWAVPATGGEPTLVREKATAGIYSPDGSKIVFRRTNLDMYYFRERSNSALWMSNADGSDLEALVPGQKWMASADAEILWPTWSPDGTHIAYQPLLDEEVRVVDVATGRVVSVAPGGRATWVDNDTVIVESPLIAPARSHYRYTNGMAGLST